MEQEKDISERIDDIRETISRNIISKDGVDTKVTASFGIGLYPDDGESLEKIINTADKNLYKAKDSGKNKVRGYNFSR